MNAASAIVVVVSVVAVLGVVAWFLFGRKDPEDTASHRDERTDARLDRPGSDGNRG